MLSGKCMDLSHLPVELLARILNRTDPDSVLSVASANKHTCNLIRSCRDMIHFDNVLLRRFIDGLPHTCSPWYDDWSDKNVHLLECCAEDTAVEHRIVGRKQWVMDGCDVRFMSIRFPAAAKFIRLKTSPGLEILFLDAALLQSMNVDGYVDVLKIMNHLVNAEHHGLIIEYDTGSTSMSMFVITNRYKQLPSCVHSCVRWEITQFNELVDHTMESLLTSRYLIYPQLPVRGFIVTADEIDIIKTFTLGLDSSEHVIEAAATRCNVIPRWLCNLPVMLHNCYYVQLAVSCYKRTSLHIEFSKKYTGRIRIYAACVNILATAGGLQAVMNPSYL